ncbi:response regulator [Paenibacillus ferrarius]|uniref:response regulator n=1 Tax=Paenibacillus ferrarius TaxID=1469647 RepID=UPI003D2E707B
MNIVLVDDEAQIRRWLEILLNQTGLGVQLVANCSNGKEALEVCRTREIDVVITDIKMPVMDGIALIRSLKAERPSIVSFILSSYSEFHYASEAIKAGAYDYLLKAEITPDDLRQALLKAQEAIDKERMRQREVFSLKSELNGNQYALRSLYFRDLLRGTAVQAAEFEEKMRMFRIPLRGNHLMLMVLRSDEHGEVKERAKISEPELLESAVINIIDETLRVETDSGCCFVAEENTYVALYNYGDWGEKSLRETTLRHAHRISGYLLELLGLSVSVGISLPAMKLTSLAEQFEEARLALSHKQFYARRSIAWYVDEDKGAGGGPERRQHHLDHLSELLDRDEFDRIVPYLRLVMKEVGQTMAWREKELKAFCIEAVFLLQRTVRRLKAAAGLDDLRQQEAERPHEVIASLPTFEHVNEWLLARAAQAMEEAHAFQHPYSEAIRKVCDYVKANYAAGVSLQEAADYVHLNRNYLSELFKKETGISFNDFLTQVRIEKVKELIVEGKTPIGQLCEKVGYPDGSYLSKVFKKVTGMTPLEFKRKKG